jgi:hypothetical protein
LIIGLTGLARCGKSTIAAELERHHGFKRVRFADPLKNMLRVLGLCEAEIEGILKEEPCSKLCGQTPRLAMQTLGTEWGRSIIGSDIWVNAWARLVAEVEGDTVAEDCRFENEAIALHDHGGVVVQVLRPGLIQGSHVSEAGVPAHLINFIVRNRGSLGSIPAMARTIIETARVCG